MANQFVLTGMMTCVDSTELVRDLSNPHVRVYRIIFRPTIRVVFERNGTTITRAGPIEENHTFYTSPRVGSSVFNHLAHLLVHVGGLTHELTEHFDQVEKLRAVLNMPEVPGSEMFKADDLGQRGDRLFKSTLKLDYGLFYTWQQWHEARKQGVTAAMRDWIDMAKMVQQEFDRQNILGDQRHPREPSVDDHAGDEDEQLDDEDEQLDDEGGNSCRSYWEKQLSRSINFFEFMATAYERGWII